MVIYYILDGWERGAVYLLAKLLAYGGALAAALKYHSQAGSFLTEKLGISTIWSGVGGFVVVAAVTDIILSELARILTRKVPQKIWESPVNKFVGGSASVIIGLTWVALVLLVILALPMKGTIKQDIRRSFLGSKIVLLAERYGEGIISEVEQVTSQAVKFLTVKPESGESVKLDEYLTSCRFDIDEASEWKNLEQVNNARQEAGSGKLSVDKRLVAVARLHSRDMAERKYFSHYSPEGEDVTDRITKAQINYQIVGENLAFAANIISAHQGLMDSEGHKRNILETRFHRVGIGVVSGGNCGVLVTQVFAD